MRKQTEFLNRLFSLLPCQVEILQFLRDERLISEESMTGLLKDRSETHPEQIALILHELAASEQLQLVDYEWTILPTELLQLTIVSLKDKRVFNYSV
jgi:hypothetical protein